MGIYEFYMSGVPLKAYIMVNCNFSGMWGGIQAGHAVDNLSHNALSEMMPDYHEEMFARWLTDYKTYVVKNGGSSDQMTELIGQLEESKIFPYASFNEQSANYLTSATAIICPDIDVLTERDKQTRQYKHLDKFDHPQWYVLQRIKRAALAR